MSYLTHVDRELTDRKLFPVLPEVREHYHELRSYKMMKGKMNDSFPKELVGIDRSALSLIFKQKLEEPEMLAEIDEIVDFSLGALSDKLSIGREVLDFVARHIEIEPVGIAPIQKEAGYLFLYYHDSKEVDVYAYLMSPVKGLKEPDQQIKTSLLTKSRISLSNSLEKIKEMLLRANRDMANPATFSVSAKIDMPYYETFLPVAKKLLMSQLAA